MTEIIVQFNIPAIDENISGVDFNQLLLFSVGGA